MPTTTTTLPKNTWVELLGLPGRWQVRGNKTVFYIEAETQPTDLSNYFIAQPGEVHHFSQIGVKLWVYTKRTGVTVAVDVPASSDVFVQDQFTRPVDFYFLRSEGAFTTVATNMVINAVSIILTDATGFSIGQTVGVSAPGMAEFYFGRILGISGNTLTVDTPIDYPFLAGSNAFNATRNMAVDGSTVTQVFQVRGAGAETGLSIDLTRLIMKCITTSAVDLSKFGDIAGGITNGLVLRRDDGLTENIFNVKTNGELAGLAYDWNAQVATNPAQGQDGFLWRYTFGGQDKHGVVIRLDPGDALEFWIQDDLSTITTLECIAAGHVVQV